MSNFNAEGIDVCSVTVVDMTMLRAQRRAALLYLEDPVIMGYLYGVRIRQAGEIFINNQEMLSYGKFMCTYRKKENQKWWHLSDALSISVCSV